ncbi:hypothetical protein OC846_006217 [Tilletia horrida]|uniref:Uncharacterized protein n=1 Tax=Tilletia horrida TaxID=155126 RepID=A0AAN6GJV5_9BASI|nr:hypothetical protein OC845_006212 [Tilletia horrida]KAK0543996.1 hypothetical protein OC846_006217 [Tilletia horrida]KAK0560242.1 hypothetical protein OC861_006350 [Tilletia horrida]
MAGGDYHPYKVDPAIERHQVNQTTMYTRFRFTPANGRFVLLWGLAIPFGIYSLAKATDGQYNWVSKTRSESLLTNPPAPVQAASEDEE